MELVSEEESDAYWATRPRGGQLAARTSLQSTVVSDAALESRFALEETTWEGRDIPRPGRWGGFRVVPDVVEFWQSRPDRLHDRLRYRRAGDEWIVERLSP